MRTTCGHPRRQPRAGTRNAPVDPAPPVRRGARPGARVERRIVNFSNRMENGRTCPLRKAAREPESATLLFYSIPSRP